MTFSLPTFLFQIVNFLVLLFILRRFVYTPLYRMIEQRRATLAQAEQEAEDARRDAAALQARLQDERDALEQERAHMLEAARQAIAAEQQRAAAVTAEAAARERADLDRELTEMRRRAAEEIGQDLLSLALEVVERLLRQAADTSLHQQLCHRLAETLEQPADTGGPPADPEEEAVLEAAQPVEPAVMDRIAAAVNRRTGHATSLTIHVDPSLIAGLRLRLGGRVWDASLAGFLADAHTALKGDASHGSSPDPALRRSPAAPGPD